MELEGRLQSTITLNGSITGSAQLVGTISSGSLTATVHKPQYVERDPYEGSYTVTPNTASNVVLETEGKRMTDDVTVVKIPYESVSNPQGGNTVTIGGY